MEIRHIAPTARSSERGLWSIHDAIDRMFEDFFRGQDVEPLRWEAGASLPSIDVAETDKEITVSADLPGMDEKDVEVSLSKDRLVIKGEKKEEKEEKKKDYYRRERRFGSVYREIALPCDVATEKATAEFKRGVLNIVLPKSTDALKESRKVPIKGA
jgi:HSP20 family protein